MHLTNPEKLILYMLAEIHEKLEIRKGIDAKLVVRAISTDNTWALSWNMPGILRPAEASIPPVVVEVSNLLEMWSSIEESYASYGPRERERIKAAADAAGTSVQFTGFDDKSETELIHVARFLIDDLKRFGRFRRRNLAASHRMAERHHRMLAVYEPMRATISDSGLSEEQLIAILEA